MPALSSHTDLSRRLSGYALAFAGAFLFATKGIFIKLAYAYTVDATTLLAIRLLLSTPFFVVIGLFVHFRQRGANPLPLRTYAQAMAVGVLGYWFASYTDFEGLVYLSPQFERLILFTYPLFVILFGAWLLRQPLKRFAVPTFAVAYAGLAVVFLADISESGNATATTLGAGWVMASSVAFALYLLLAKPLISRMGASLFTSVAMIGAALATFTHFGLTHRLESVSMEPGLWSLSLGLAIGATVLPGYLVSFALARISSQANAVIGFVNPVITMGLSVMILKETISLTELIGTVLVLIGVGLYTWLDQKSLTSGKSDVSTAG